MIKTLRESKARLSELVDLASRGEDVIITVRGKPKARLSRVIATRPRKGSIWIQELKSLQRRYTRGRKPSDNAPMMDQLREERH